MVIITQGGKGTGSKCQQLDICTGEILRKILLNAIEDNTQKNMTSKSPYMCSKITIKLILIDDYDNL